MTSKNARFVNRRIKSWRRRRGLTASRLIFQHFRMSSFVILDGHHCRRNMNVAQTLIPKMPLRFEWFDLLRNFEFALKSIKFSYVKITVFCIESTWKITKYGCIALGQLTIVPDRHVHFLLTTDMVPLLASIFLEPEKSREKTQIEPF